MKKRYKVGSRCLAWFLCLAMVLSLVPITVFAAGEPAGVPAGATKIRASGQMISTGGNYYCEGNISSQVAISGGTESNPVRIYINGTVNCTHNNTSPPFRIYNGYVEFIGVNNAKVINSRSNTIDASSSLDAECYITIKNIVFDGNNTGDTYQLLVFGGDYLKNLTMENCTVQNWNGSGYGAVALSGSNLTASITDCNFSNNSGLLGGVMLNRGIVTFTRCTFEGNTGATYAGALMVGYYVTKCELIDCTIGTMSNSNKGTNGGGIQVQYDNVILKGTTTVTGNKTTDGTADSNICLNSGKTITIDNGWTGTAGVCMLGEPTVSNPVKRITATSNEVSVIEGHITSDNSSLICYYAAETKSNPAVTQGYTYLAVHSHNWEYSVGADGNENKVYAWCKQDTPIKCNYYGTDTTDANLVLTLTADSTDYSGDSYSGASMTNNITEVTGANAGAVYYKGIGSTSYAESTTAPTNAGTYKAIVTIVGKTAEKEFTIEKKAITPVVTMDDWVFNETAKEPSVTGNIGNGGVTYYYKQQSEADTAYTTTKPTSIGDYVVKAVITETGNYKGGEATTDFSIAAATMTGVSASGYTGEYDGKPHNIIVTKPAGAKVTYSTSQNGTYTETNPAYINAGTNTVWYKVEMEGYNPVIGSADVAITKAALTVKAENITIIYGDAVPTYTVTYDGFKNSENKAVLGGILEFECSYAQFSAQGTYTITPKGYASDNYKIVYENGTLTVVQKEIVIEWGTKEFIYQSGVEQAPVATVSNAVNNDNLTLTISGAKVNAGADYTATVISVIGDKASNYKLPTSGLFTDFVIKNAEQTAPNVSGVAETISKKADGKIIGVDSTMEYRKEDEIIYTAISGTEISNLPAGKYYVRYVAKTNYNASPETEVIIGEGRKLTVTVPASQIGYTLTASAFTLNWHDTAELDFAMVSGYYKTDAFVVKVNGTAVELLDHKYTASDVETDIIVTVEGIADITAPTANINITTNNWNSFLNGITFGLFFKKTQTVTITAEDVNTGSGLNKIYYYLSTEEMTIDMVKEMTDWTEYTEAFNIDSDKEYVIYAKAMDNAGNTVYVNSNGIVLDKIAPAITEIENGATYYGDTIFKADDKYLAGVTVDGEVVGLTDGAYTIVADNTGHTIVATDKAGNFTEYKIMVCKIYTVTFVVDGETVSTMQVNHGADAALPEIPAKAGYTAVWDKDGRNITTDTTITVVYTKNAEAFMDSPQTGDSRNLWLWFAVLFIGEFGIVATTAYRSRKHIH